MRDVRFTFLCTREERQLLASVARRLARTESDVMRLLVREAARELGLGSEEASLTTEESDPTPTETSACSSDGHRHG